LASRRISGLDSVRHKIVYGLSFSPRLSSKKIPTEERNIEDELHTGDILRIVDITRVISGSSRILVYDNARHLRTIFSLLFKQTLTRNEERRLIGIGKGRLYRGIGAIGEDLWGLIADEWRLSADELFCLIGGNQVIIRTPQLPLQGISLSSVSGNAQEVIVRLERPIIHDQPGLMKEVSGLIIDLGGHLYSDRSVAERLDLYLDIPSHRTNDLISGLEQIEERALIPYTQPVASDRIIGIDISDL